MDKESAIECLTALRSQQSTYHDHKEKTAWWGVIFHFAVCSAIVATWTEQPLEAAYRFWGVVVVSVFTVMLIFFVVKQLELRKDAASFVGAATILELEVRRGGDVGCATDWTPPARLEENANNSSKKRHVEYIFPKILIDKANEVTDTLHKVPILSWILFGFLLLSGFAAALAICFFG